MDFIKNEFVKLLAKEFPEHHLRLHIGLLEVVYDAQYTTGQIECHVRSLMHRGFRMTSPYGEAAVFEQHAAVVIIRDLLTMMINQNRWQLEDLLGMPKGPEYLDAFG